MITLHPFNNQKTMPCQMQVQWYNGNKKTVSAYLILQVVSRELKIPVEELRSKARHRHLADARKIFILCCCLHNLYRLGALKKILNRDHSSVSVGKSTGEGLLKTDKSFRKDYDRCVLSIQNFFEKDNLLETTKSI